MTEGNATHSILVADDEPTLRMAFAFALENESTNVIQANDGREALDILAAKQVDAVLMDLRMPRLNGLEAVELMRANQDLTPVILCSAHVRTVDVLQALRCGVVDFLFKPVELLHLREVLASIFQSPATPRAAALHHARRMDFQQAVEILDVGGVSDEDAVWAETFLTLASPTSPPAGFFDTSVGVQRLENMVFCR